MVTGRDHPRHIVRPLSARAVQLGGWLCACVGLGCSQDRLTHSEASIFRAALQRRQLFPRNTPRALSPLLYARCLNGIVSSDCQCNRRLHLCRKEQTAFCRPNSPYCYHSSCIKATGFAHRPITCDISDKKCITSSAR